MYYYVRILSGGNDKTWLFKFILPVGGIVLGLSLLVL